MSPTRLEKWIFAQKPALLVLFCALSCWAIVALAVTGGYHVGDQVVSWIEDTDSAIAARETSTDPANPDGLDLIAEELSTIAPAAGGDE